MLLSFFLGVIVGVLLAMVAMISHRIGALFKTLPQKFQNQQATIVQTKDPLDVDLN